jgi:acetyl-CoA C-acetyltransferase
MDKKNIPIIVGAAQFTQPKGTSEPLDPLNLMLKTSKMAISDTQSKKLIEYIDAVYMINIISWSYEDGPGELCRDLGIKPIKKVYLPDGGHSPQMLINRAANDVVSGNLRCVLITGGEAAYSIFKTFKNQRPEHWPERKMPKYIEKRAWEYTNKIERKYGFRNAPLTYAIFETALRASSGRNLKDHNKYMGKLFEHFSKHASNNPYSWTQEYFTAEEIITPTPENRYIDHPYTKRMCANMFVDQSASLLITNEELAKLLKIKREKWVYLMGGADLHNIPHVSRRPKLDTSPAVKEATRIALNQAGLTLKDINKFDLYSCFPSIVEIIMNELGIKEDDPRDLTITGGLPYFGGPLSVYSLHSIINAVELIRKNNSLKVLVVANGGYNTKESVGIYGSEPPVIPWGTLKDQEVQETILENALPEPVENANGKLAIEGYSIMYSRFGQPERAIFIGTLQNGERTLAIIKSGSKINHNLEEQELVGKTCTIEYDPQEDRNLVLNFE